MNLRLLADQLTVCRLPPDAPVQPPAETTGLWSLTHTATETSLVCTDPPHGARTEPGWRALQVAGPLDFGLVGVLAALTAPLADAGVSVFTLSTFDTDYVLVKDADLQAATIALVGDGHAVHAADEPGMPLFHLAAATEWDAAVQAGDPYIPAASGGPAGLDGFIHCSTAAQVAGTATGWFAGRDDLVLISLDPAVLGDALLYEPGALGEADLFPHLYAPIDPASVIAAAPYRGPT